MNINEVKQTVRFFRSKKKEAQYFETLKHWCGMLSWRYSLAKLTIMFCRHYINLLSSLCCIPSMYPCLSFHLFLGSCLFSSVLFIYVLRLCLCFFFFISRMLLSFTLSPPRDYVSYVTLFGLVGMRKENEKYIVIMGL